MTVAKIRQMTMTHPRALLAYLLRQRQVAEQFAKWLETGER